MIPITWTIFNLRVMKIRGDDHRDNTHQSQGHTKVDVSYNYYYLKWLPIQDFFKEYSSKNWDEDYDWGLHDLEETEGQMSETDHLDETVGNSQESQVDQLESTHVVHLEFNLRSRVLKNCTFPFCNALFLYLLKWSTDFLEIQYNLTEKIKKLINWPMQRKVVWRRASFMS